MVNKSTTSVLISILDFQ